jgi:chromosomal replication initiation ATPase DnaA
VAFSLWAPDDELLRKLAHKLFDDRQLAVPETTVEQIIRAVERSPASIRALVAQADAKALAENRTISAALIREILAQSVCDAG